jgi:hypothetical protein
MKLVVLICLFLSGCRIWTEPMTGRVYVGLTDCQTASTESSNSQDYISDLDSSEQTSTLVSRIEIRDNHAEYASIGSQGSPAK